MNQALVDYILQAKKHGLTEMEIKENLLMAGWEAAEVEAGFSQAKILENRAQNPSYFSNTSKNNQQNWQASEPQVISAANVFTKSGAITQNTQKIRGLASKKNVLSLVFLILLLSSASVYAYYNFWRVTPDKIWQSFAANQINSEPFQANITLKLSQAGRNDFQLDLNSASFQDLRDPQNAKADMNATLGLKSGQEQAKFQFGLIYQNKNLFLDLTKVPQAKGLFGDNNPGWIKLRPKEIISEKTKTTSTSDSAVSSKTLEIGKIFEMFGPGKTVSKEKLGGIQVYHLSLILNKDKLFELISDKASLFSKYLRQAISAEELSQIKQLVENTKVEESDIWVGRNDHKLYKIRLSLKVPQIKNGLGVLPGFGLATRPLNDSRRVVDINFVVSALELYKQDLGGFPPGKNGLPIELSPRYIDKFPTAPQPAEGNCSEYYNTYWYEPAGQPKTIKGKTLYPSYQLTFCLGDSVGSTYKAGLGKATPETGIQTGLPCSDKPEYCPSGTAAENNNQEFLNILFEGEFSNYGAEKTLNEPAEFLDFSKSLQSQQ